MAGESGTSIHVRLNCNLLFLGSVALPSAHEVSVMDFECVLILKLKLLIRLEKGFLPLT